MRGYVFVPGNAQCFASSFASVAKHRPLLESITYLERYFLSFVTNRSLDLSAVSSQASVLHQKLGRATLGLHSIYTFVLKHTSITVSRVPLPPYQRTPRQRQARRGAAGTRPWCRAYCSLPR